MNQNVGTASSLRLRLLARADSAQLLRQRLYLWMDELGARRDEIFDVALACTEAFANAVEHPHEPSAAVIDVAGSLDGSAVTITVHDYGSWNGQHQREQVGFGFPIMRQLMTSVEVDTQLDGTTITMQRQLADPSPPGTLR